jgi:hypothetical protein
LNGSRGTSQICVADASVSFESFEMNPSAITALQVITDNEYVDTMYSVFGVADKVPTEFALEFVRKKRRKLSNNVRSDSET